MTNNTTYTPQAKINSITLTSLPTVMFKPIRPDK
jgi:hypothetical protein